MPANGHYSAIAWGFRVPRAAKIVMIRVIRDKGLYVVGSGEVVRDAEDLQAAADAVCRILEDEFGHE